VTIRINHHYQIADDELQVPDVLETHRISYSHMLSPGNCRMVCFAKIAGRRERVCQCRKAPGLDDNA
jgi:hypothetical protein